MLIVNSSLLIDRSKELADIYSVVAVPSLLLFKNGELIWRNTGFMNMEELRAVLIKNR